MGTISKNYYSTYLSVLDIFLKECLLYLEQHNMWFSTVNSYWLNNVFMCWRKWKDTRIFCFIVIPDLTFKWRSQRTMMYHYLTEMGFKLFKRQHDLYLNSKVASDKCNATGLWLSLKPESKIVPLIYSCIDYSSSERITHFMVILCES